MVLKRNQYIFILCLILLSFKLYAAISLDVEPKVTPIHEPFEVIYTIENVSVNSSPDFSPLTRDFIILGTKSRNQYNNINGKISALNQISLTLMAKRAGMLTIPSINFGPMRTPVGHVEITTNKTKTNVTGVTNKSKALTLDASDNYDDAVFIKTTLTPLEGYVNQQFIYTVKLYNNGQLLDTEYNPPKAENALVIPLGNSYRYRTIENNKNYIVEAQNYAVFAQNPGKLSILGPVFNALLYESMPNRVTLAGKTIHFDVKPIPDNFTNKNWLALRGASIKETYENLKNSYDIGESVVRTISLTVTGSPAELVPELSFESNDKFDVYADPPILDNVIKQQDVQGNVTIKLTYILHQSGEVIFPEITIPWFNVQTNKTQMLKLPARTVIVNKDNKVLDNKENNTSKIAKLNIKKNEILLNEDTDNSRLVSYVNKINLIFILFGFIIAIIVLGLYKLFSALVLKRKNYNEIFRQLKKACKNNNSENAKNAVILWFKINGVSANNLYELADMVYDKELCQELKILGDIIYKEDENLKSIWQGNSLWHRVKRYTFKKPKNKQRNNDNLPPLYPDI